MKSIVFNPTSKVDVFLCAIEDPCIKGVKCVFYCPASAVADIVKLNLISNVL